MRLFDLFTKDELDAQIVAKMVKATPHPTEGLVIYNYTQMAAFTPELWNHVTDLCRGLIVDREGNLIARGFQKFWNIDDARHPETMMENLPTDPPVLTRKMDGSLGILYWPDDDSLPYIATRGSFASEQAEWATRWLQDHMAVEWPNGFTPLFEIVYPENQIVVRYDYSGLVLLALVDIATGAEVDYEELASWAERNNVRVVEKFDKPLELCVTEDDPSEEGYVAAWDRVGAPPLRVKIKYETYCKLHRLLTQTNAVTVWEMLRDGLDLTTLTADVPAEFRGWIDGLEKRFVGEFKAIEDAALSAMLAYPGEKNISNTEDKKSFALYVIGNHSDVAPIMFSMVSGKDYRGIIWKHIRPRGDDRSFKTDEL